MPSEQQPPVRETIRQLGLRLETACRQFSRKMGELSSRISSSLPFSQKISSLRKTGWEADGLRGKVREMLTIDYDVVQKDGDDVRLMTGKSVRKYDPIGNMTEWSIYNADGSLRKRHVSKHDEDGNLVEGVEQQIRKAWYKTACRLRKEDLKTDEKGNRLQGNGTGTLHRRKSRFQKMSPRTMSRRHSLIPGRRLLESKYVLCAARRW